MQHRTLTCLAVVSVLALAGCNGGNSPDKLAQRQISAMEEFSGVLAKITDPASAEKQKGAIEDVIEKMNKLRKEMEALPAEKQKEGEALAEKLGPEMQAAMSKMMAEMMRIGSNVEIQAVLQPVLAKLDG